MMWKWAVSFGGRRRSNYCISLLHQGIPVAQNPSGGSCYTTNSPVLEFNHRAFGSLLDIWGIKNVVRRQWSYAILPPCPTYCSRAIGYCGSVGADLHSKDSDEGLEPSSACSNVDDSGQSMSDNTVAESSHERSEPSSACSNVDGSGRSMSDNAVAESSYVQSVDFVQVDKDLLPTVIILGRPNVGKSALFNRLIRRREALVYNTPADHVTRDIRDGVAKLGDLRFRVLDSAGLEAAASSGSILERTAEMTASILSRAQAILFLMDGREGLHPLDLQVGKWLRKHASGIKTLLVMNKTEALDITDGSLAAVAGEAYRLGFGDPIPISAETGQGMAELYSSLRPLLDEHMVQVLNGQVTQDSDPPEADETKLPLQLAIVGRPNVGKSTLLNTLLQENRVLVGPEAGLTRDSIRTQFEHDGRTIYMVDTAGWLERTKQEKGPASLSVMQTRKNLMRAHIIALVLDAEEIAKARRSMKHAEVVIARQAVEEGRGLVVVVNKMDLLKGKNDSRLYDDVTRAVPEEIQTLIPQITGIPVVFASALEGRGRIAIMRQVIETYEKWCLRLPTARLNRWLRKVMSRHSWKDQSTQPKIKYFTQVKARPPTFVAFVKGKTELSDSDLRFLTKSLKEDFDMGGIPIRILQRCLARNDDGSSTNSNISCRKKSHGKKVETFPSSKRSVLV